MHTVDGTIHNQLQKFVIGEEATGLNILINRIY
jgi:hypothetical protein